MKEHKNKSECFKESSLRARDTHSFMVGGVIVLFTLNENRGMTIFVTVSLQLKQSESVDNNYRKNVDVSKASE